LIQSASSIDCDVIVVNYNAGNSLVLCVDSILVSGAARVIVVDNCSNDGSLEPLPRSEVEDRLLVIRNEQNLGFASACNIGVRASTASHLLFMNPDGVLCSNALSRMMDMLECSSTIGMVGGYLSNPDGTEQPGGRRELPTPAKAFIRAFGLSRLSSFFPGTFKDFLLHNERLPSEPTPVEAISGACMLVKREALDDVGLWDEGYFLHCEDLDLCMRFSQKGWDIFFVPDAKIIHDQGTCSRSRPIFVEWHKHKGMMRFYRKFYRNQYPAALCAVIAIGVWLRFGLVASCYCAHHVLDWMGIRRG